MLHTRLLKQRGLISHRNGRSKELFKPCRASDYAGLKIKYIRKYEDDRSEATEINTAEL